MTSRSSDAGDMTGDDTTIGTRIAARLHRRACDIARSRPLEAYIARAPDPGAVQRARQAGGTG